MEVQRQERKVREVGDDADKRAPGGSEREGERERGGGLGRLGWGFLGRTVGPQGKEREGERELGWAGLGKVRRKGLFCFFST